MRLTERVHAALKDLITAGDYVIDATMGNGHDTLFLSKLVGPKGHVWAFDIQKEALEKTHSRLEGANCTNATLIHASHADMAKYIPHNAQRSIKACVFNLGYLPGHDKKTTTKSESTLKAVNSAISLLAPKGSIHILSYTGHPEGLAEWHMFQKWIDQHTSDEVRITQHSEFDAKRRPPVWLEISKI